MRLRAFLAGALASGALIVGPPVTSSGFLPTTSPPGSAEATVAFVGSRVCRDCHAATHSTWTNGRHSRMLQETRPAAVIPAFGGAVTLHGRKYELSREGDDYFVVERYLQSAPVKRRVDFTLGSRRVQHYLSRLSDGRIVVLPPSYDVEKKEWFHNLDIVDLEESSRVKVQVWNSNCFGCHVSGEEKGFDPVTRTYRTTWTDFGTSCERCHGPGGDHAAKYARDAKATAAPSPTRLNHESAPDGDTLILHPRRVDKEISTTLCAQCHTLRDITRPGFSGGSNYYDYFTPLLEYAQKKNHDPAYWPNGRPRRFSNEAVAFWQSQCYFKGGATCLSCHTDVHEPDIEKNENLAEKQDGLCAGCHREIAASGSKHTHHGDNPQASTTSVSCVSCHMPRTLVSLRHRMPDHTISVPAPENTKRFGIPNACNECHADRSPDWAEARLATWFPGGRRVESVTDAMAFSKGASRDPLGIEPLLKIAADPDRPPLMRANALGHLRNYPDSRVTSALLSATTETHPALRLVSVLSLSDRTRNPAVREAVEQALEDTRRTVRMGAALGLLNAGLQPPPAGGASGPLSEALQDHAARARFLNEDPGAQLDLGKMLFLAGVFKEAESSLRDALRLEPTIRGGHYFLGLATLGQGRVAEATALLKSVDGKDPHRRDAEAILAKLKSPPAKGPG